MRTHFRHFARVIALLVAALSVPGLASAQGFGGLSGAKDPLRTTLISDVTQVAAGEAFHIGVLLELDDGWHTYWHNPKDGGDAPKVTWKLPAGFTAGPILWPLPERFIEPGDFINYGYARRVLLQVRVTPPAELKARTPLPFAATVKWQACAETCIYGEAKTALTLTSGTTAHASKQHAFFAATRAATPGAPPAEISGIQLSWAADAAVDGIVRSGTWTALLRGQDQAKLAQVFPFALAEGAINEPTIQHTDVGWVATFKVDGLSKKFAEEQLAALFVVHTPKKNSFVVRAGTTFSRSPGNGASPRGETRPKPAQKKTTGRK